MASVPVLPTDLEASERPDSSHPTLANTATTSPARRLRWHALGITFTLIFLLDLAGGFGDTPWLRICESIVCRNHYKAVDPSLIGHNGAVDEEYCKINPVQDELAFLFGWSSFFDYLPGLFLAIPYGILSDKYGRRWLMVMNVTSLCFRSAWSYIVFSFPNTFSIRMLWLQGAFSIFGGGITVTSTLFHVVLTDVTPETRRSTVFCYAYALVFLTYFIGPPISSVLMDRSPWIPLNIGICLWILSVAVVLALPETLQATESSPDTPNFCRTADTADPHSKPSTFKTFGKSKKPSPLNRITALLISILEDSRFLLKDWRILFLLSTTVANNLATLDGPLLQYVSKRYSWPLSKTAYLTSFRGAVSVITLLVFLPGLSACLLKLLRVAAFEKDIILSRISFTLITAGVLIVALAPSISIFIVGFFMATLGSGAQAMIRSLLAGLVKPTEVARLFSAISIISTITALVSQPLKASLYSWGMSKGGAWIGMPFLVCGIIMGLSTISFWLIRLEGRVQFSEEESLLGKGYKDEDSLVTRNDLLLRTYDE